MSNPFSQGISSPSIDLLVTRWKADGYYAPRPPASEAARQSFATTVRTSFGMHLPPDYERFLSLTDGGQYDFANLYGVGPEDNVLDRCRELQTGRTLLIGCSGNVDAYVLRGNGACEIVNTFRLDDVNERFSSFSALLDEILKAARPKK